jgi:hypothetical protein
MEAIRRLAARTRPLDPRWGMPGTAALEMDSEGPVLDALSIPELPTLVTPSPVRPRGPVARARTAGGGVVEVESNGTWTALNEVISDFEAAPAPLPARPLGMPLKLKRQMGLVDADVFGEEDDGVGWDRTGTAFGGYGYAGLTGIQRWKVMANLKRAYGRLAEKQTKLAIKQAGLSERVEAKRQANAGMLNGLMRAVFNGTPAARVGLLRQQLAAAEGQLATMEQDLVTLTRELQGVEGAMTDMASELALFGLKV